MDDIDALLKKHRYLVNDKRRIESIIYGDEKLEKDEEKEKETMNTLFPFIVLAFFFCFGLQINKIMHNFNQFDPMKVAASNVMNIPKSLEDSILFGMAAYQTPNNVNVRSGTKVNQGDMNHKKLLFRETFERELKEKIEKEVEKLEEEVVEDEEEEDVEYEEHSIIDLIRSGEVIKGGTAIVVLLHNNQSKSKQVDDLTISLRTLPFLLGDDPDALAPVLIFSSDQYPLRASDKAKLALALGTNRPILFPSYTNNDNDSKKDKVTVKDEDETIIIQPPSNSNEIWITRLNNHPILRHFRVLLKLNTNFCFRTFNDQLPSFDTNLSYHAQYGGLVNVERKEHKAFITFIQNYLEENNIQPKNKKMWNFLMDTSSQMPYLQTNFEIITKANFLKRRDILQWYEYVRRKGIQRLFKYSAGVKEDILEGIIQFLTIAIFMEDEEIRTTNPAGFHYGSEECKLEDIESSLAYLY